MKRLIVLFLVAAFLLAGCAKKAPEATTPTMPSAPAASSEGQAAPAAAPQEEVKPVGDEKCTDSDGGKNYAVKGKVSGIKEMSGASYEVWDSCVKDYVNEYYCSELGKPQTDIHKCPNGCKDSVCI